MHILNRPARLYLDRLHIRIKYLPLHIDEEETVEELESEPLISVYKPRLKDKQEAS